MVNRAKLTKRSVEALKPGPEQFFVWDTELKGFGVRVLKSGTKSFVLQYRLKQQRRLVLGKFPPLSVDKARDPARRALADIAEGQDPAAEKKKQKAAAIVSEMCDAYLVAARAGLVIGRAGTVKKESTLSVDAGRIERHIKPLLGGLRATEVTSAHIEQFKNAVAQGKTRVDVKTGLRGRAIVKGGKGTATRTVGLLGGIFEWARAQGLVVHNPVRGVRRFADGRREILYTDNQLALLGAVLRKLERAAIKRLDSTR